MIRPRLLLALAAAYGILSPGGSGRAFAKLSPVGAITSIAEPLSGQVVQRRDDNVGNILIVGTYSGNVDGFQARTSLQPGMTGNPRGWAPLIDVTIFGGQFIGVYRQPAGGFYNLEIRPVFGGQAGQTGPSVIVYTVGVGEVFITAGQSNTTNWGSATDYYPSPLVACFDDGTGRGIDPNYPGASWRWGYDPQPAIDQSTGGSPWPTMANNLAVVLQVPIGLYAAGCGGTALQAWLPGFVMAPTATTPQMVLFNRLTNAITYFNNRGGVRAVLWHQGETDYLAQTNPIVYRADLGLIIEQSRAATGVPIKWMVAQATTPLLNDIPLRVGLEDAQAAVVDNVLTFPGPVTDFIGLPYRNYVAGLPVHFNAPGLEFLGGAWGAYVANIPGFLGSGILPAF